MHQQAVSFEDHVDDALEPLYHISIPPAFHQSPRSPRRFLSRSVPALNDTPTSETFSLPTPCRPADSGLNNVRFLEDNLQALAHQESISITEGEDYPAAPLLKDLDSFSQGTGLGSFDFSLNEGYDDLLSSSSVAFSPTQPEASIESWRLDVSRSASCDALSSSYSEMCLKVEADTEEPYQGVEVSVSLQCTLGLRPKRELSCSSSVVSVAVEQDDLIEFGGKAIEAKRRRVEKAEVSPVADRPSAALPLVDDGAAFN